MSESSVPPETQTVPEPAPPSAPKRDRMPVLYGVGFIILAAGIGYVWQDSRQRGADPQMAERLRTLQSRVAQLDQTQSQIGAQIQALDKHPAAPDLSPVMNRLSALEQRPSADPKEGARVDVLSGRVEALSGRQQTAESELVRRLDALEARLSRLESDSGQVNAVAERASKLARIQAASAALAAGQKLGVIPGAPPALARFAKEDPPTESGLRLTYPRAEKAALAASRPDDTSKPLLDRVLARTESLVTVRQGDHVVIGDAAAGVLARARAALDAGDLAKAVSAISGLTGAPADAMGSWLADAKALLDARAALADMAEHA